MYYVYVLAHLQTGSKKSSFGAPTSLPQSVYPPCIASYFTILSVFGSFVQKLYNYSKGANHPILLNLDKGV